MSDYKTKIKVKVDNNVAIYYSKDGQEIEQGKIDLSNQIIEVTESSPFGIWLERYYYKDDIFINKSDCEEIIITETSCPECGYEAPEFSGQYKEFEGKKYPIFLNERKYFNGHNDLHDWDEIHYCPNCKKEFQFSTGI